MLIEHNLIINSLLLLGCSLVLFYTYLILFKFRINVIRTLIFIAFHALIVMVAPFFYLELSLAFVHLGIMLVAYVVISICIAKFLAKACALFIAAQETTDS